jgi:site-specific DNA-cytosine methylase
MSSIKVLDLFSGCGGLVNGLLQSKISVVLSNEYWKPAHNTNKLNHKNTEHILGDITNDEIKKSIIEKSKKLGVNVIAGGPPCFIKGTKVLTYEGYKDIENISLEDKLMTHTGKFQKIINLQRKIYNDLLYTIKVKYIPHNIVCTKEHPFYVREKHKKWNNYNRKYDIEFGKPKWKNAEDMSKDDYVGVFINQNSIIPKIEYENVINQHTVNSKIKILDKEYEWYMMGYFIGDGWLDHQFKKKGHNRYRIKFVIADKQKNEVLPILEKTFNLYECKNSGQNCTKYEVYNKFWWEILVQFGRYAHGKYIPEWVQDAPKHLVQKFIDGYMMADGNIKNNIHRLTTVSYNLAFGIQRLYLKLGIISSITKTIRPKTHIIEGRIVNQRDTYCIRFTFNKKRSICSFIENNYVWLKLFDIEKNQAQNTDVFNFEVDIDNSYIVENVIVHNCQAYSNAGNKDQFDNRGQLYKDYMDIVENIKPELCIMENVKGILSMTHLKDIITEEEEKILEEYKEIEIKWFNCKDKNKKKEITKEKNKLSKLLKKHCNEYVTDKIHRKFSELGYKSEHKVLNSADYGCPQRRERVIFIAVKKKYNIIYPSPTHSESPTENRYSESNKKLKKWISVRQAIDHIRSKHTPDMIKRMSETKYEQSAQPKYKEAYFKCHPDKPSLTVKENHGAVFVHYEKPRCMTPRELARLQTFPDNFKFTGSKKDILVQIGNAVPCLLGKHIGNSIIKMLT